MNDLATRLRASVDGVDPVTLDEVLAAAGTGAGSSPRPRRRLVAIAAAVLVVVVLGTTVALVARRGEHSSLRTTSSTTSTATIPSLPADPATCPLIDGRPSCVVTPDQAAELLGFVVPRPSRVPEGWVEDLFAVDDFPPRSSRNATDEPLLVSRQIWKPEGTDRTQDLAAWALLDVQRVRPTDVPLGIETMFTLDDGTEVRGDSLPAIVSADPGADPMQLTSLYWTRDGLTYWLFARVLTLEQATDLVRSIS